MSTKQGEDVSLKDKEDLEQISSDLQTKSAKMSSVDQVDHSANIDTKTTQIITEKLQEEHLDAVSGKSITDSGIKVSEANVSDKSDIKTSGAGPDQSDTDILNSLDNSGEEMHLQWDDDDVDDEGVVSSDVGEKKEKVDIEKSISKDSDVAVNEKKDTDDIEIMLPNDSDIAIDDNEEIDENLLLESSDEVDDSVYNKSTIENIELYTIDDENKLLADDDDEVITTVNTVTDKIVISHDGDKTNVPIHLITKNSNLDKIDNSKPESSTLDVKNSHEHTSKEMQQVLSMETDKNKTSIEETDDEIIIGKDKAVSSSSPNESMSNTTIDINLEHKLNNPDAILEIPTQEIIDIMDDTDVSITCIDDDKMNSSLETKKGDKTKDIDMDMTIETDQLESLDKNADTSLKTSTVTEQEWTDIEKQLKTFETSIVEDSENISLVKDEIFTQTKDLELPTDSNNKETKIQDTIPLKSQIADQTNQYKSEMLKLNEDTPKQQDGVGAQGDTVEAIGKNDTQKFVPMEIENMSSLEANNEVLDSAETNIEPEIVKSTNKLVTESTKQTSPSKKKARQDLDTNEVKVLTSEITSKEQPSESEIQVEEATSNSTEQEITTKVEGDEISSKLDEEAHKSDNDEQTKVEATVKADSATEILSEINKKVLSSKMDIDSSNEELQSPIKSPEDLEIERTSKSEQELQDQPSTSSKIENEVTPSTKFAQNENEPSTSTTQNEVKPSTSTKDKNDIQTSTSYEDIQPSTSTGHENEVLPSTSFAENDKPSASFAENDKPSTSFSQNDAIPSTTSAQIEPKASTSDENHLLPDSSNDVPEVTDSLGLLAESSRVMEDDEDDDDDFYPEDESSNQMTAEHSEDSNPPNSETDVPKETDSESPQEEKGQPQFNFTDEDEKDAAVKEMDEDMEEDAFENENEDQPEQDIETVKLSDDEAETVEEDKSSPSKSSQTLPKTVKVINIVDLEESSSEDDTQVVAKIDDAKEEAVVEPSTAIIQESEVIADDENTVSESASEDKNEKPEATKETTTVEEADSTTSINENQIPETKPSTDTSKAKPHKFSLEIFSLDSDEDESATPNKELTETDIEKVRESNKCINLSCESTGNITYYVADPATITYYDAARKRKAMVCEACVEVVAKRTQSLVNGIKEFTPLLDLDIDKEASELVEISDSDSEPETEEGDATKETIGEAGAAFIEAELAKAINETWLKFKMDSRLDEAQDALNKEMKKLEEETGEIDLMLSECQVATDKLRNELYATFEQDRHELHTLIIHDTPTSMFVCLENALVSQQMDNSVPVFGEPRGKRRLSSANESASKRPAIPLGYAPLDGDKDAKCYGPTVETTKADDDKDIAVLKVSAESAPSDLPPPGELSRPPLKTDMWVYAMKNSFGSWTKAKVLEVQGKAQVPGASTNFTICRVKLFSKSQSKQKLLPARCLAYPDPTDVRMTIGTRVIAMFRDPMNALKRETYYSGIVAEVPNPVNNYRYLVFFDDGYAQYVSHKDTRLVCECSPLVWEEVHAYSREFVRKYLIAYPERPMVRLHRGQSLKTEWNGKWWTSRVIQVDASLVQVHFEEDNRTEWIYRGSTRLAPLYLELQAAERHRARPMPRTKAQARVNMPYVEYTRSDENRTEHLPPPPQSTITAHEREMRQRAVAKKSTATAVHSPAQTPVDGGLASRVVYYTPKLAVKPHKMVPHQCGPQCKRTDTLALKDLRTYNPLAKPLLSGWERQIVRYHGQKSVMYRAPCGRRLRHMRELHSYLRAVRSDMAVDLFDFTPHTHCLAEFVLNKCLVSKKDLSHGKENVPVPCVNFYDESLPEFCSYNTERTPTAGVPLNLDPEFLCGCDCTDDCEDKTKCACWKMTLEGANTIGLRGSKVGYVYKRLPEPLPSGIYECNSRCKCKHTCLNRVAQHPLQLKLQVFKTLNRGWGIRALNDVPKGAFLCVYAGNLLTDATANMDGLNEGDEYLAELDYIEVVEQMKEGFEEDIPDADKRLDKGAKVRDVKQDKKNTANVPEESDMSSSEDEEMPSKNEKEDGDFCPGHIGMGVAEFSKRLRKRDRKNKEGEEDAGAKEEKPEKPDEDCITISDDEEVREPSRFMAEAGMESNEFVSKYRSVRSHFGKDEACYIMDAKVQGNIGRYLNHSCMPNVFVQNVFVDTHDPRFPWVAFFALSHIKAGTELTWNYNYDVGSVPGKTLYCYCGAPNCRGRLL